MSAQDRDLRGKLRTRIAELRDDPKALIFDTEINAMIAPWRFNDPIQFSCRCGQPLSWWALDPQIAIIRTAKRRTLKGESSGIGGIYEFVDSALDGPDGFGPSEREAMMEQHGRKHVELADNPDGGVTGIVTRRKWTCGKCGAEYPLNNSTMLRAYVDVVTSPTRRTVTM